MKTISIILGMSILMFGCSFEAKALDASTVGTRASGRDAGVEKAPHLISYSPGLASIVEDSYGRKSIVVFGDPARMTSIAASMSPDEDNVQKLKASHVDDAVWGSPIIRSRGDREFVVKQRENVVCASFSKFKPLYVDEDGSRMDISEEEMSTLIKEGKTKDRSGDPNQLSFCQIALFDTSDVQWEDQANFGRQHEQLRNLKAQQESRGNGEVKGLKVSDFSKSDLPNSFSESKKSFAVISQSDDSGHPRLVLNGKVAKEMFEYLRSRAEAGADGVSAKQPSTFDSPVFKHYLYKKGAKGDDAQMFTDGDLTCWSLSPSASNSDGFYKRPLSIAYTAFKTFKEDGTMDRFICEKDLGQIKSGTRFLGEESGEDTDGKEVDAIK